MKVYVFPDGNPGDRYNFVAPIRLLDPLRALAKQYDLTFCCHQPGSESELFHADVAILQRACFSSRQALDNGLNLLAKARASGTRIVYELDDHIFCPNLPELIADSEIDQLDEESFELTQAHVEILPLADYITCPTEPLATALRELKHSAEVCVVPTFLDFDHPRWNQGFVRTRGEGRRLNIGWSGGSRVGRDLEIMAQDLVRVVRRHANVTVVIAGALKYAPLFSEIPKQQFCGVNWVTYDYYPRLLTVFDLALIPMQDHAYNRCKSALKIIDYAAIGVSSICSPVTPFTDFPETVNTPVFAENGEWLTRIEEFLEETTTGPVSSAELEETVRTQYGLRENLVSYWTMLNKVIGVTAEEPV